VTLLLPEVYRSGLVREETLEKYRQGVGQMLESAFGQDYVIGFRFGPHNGRDKGRHLHVLLSLLRFPIELRPRAKTFANLDEESKRRLLPTFFVGKHLDRNEIKPALLEPYSALVRSLFGDFTDDPSQLIDVRACERPVQTSKDRVDANNYLSEVYALFKEIDILGFYKDRPGSEVLLQYSTGTKARFREGVEEFVRGKLLVPRVRWFRRGSRGFMYGGNTFAKIVDYAAKLLHPTNPKLCFLDQTPKGLKQQAAKAIEELAHDPINVIEAVSPSVPKEHPFPHDQLGSLLAAWPFLSLRFIPPASYWTGRFVLAGYGGVRDIVPQILQPQAVERHALFGCILFPDVVAMDRGDVLGVRALISKVWFDEADQKQASGWCDLPGEEQERYLPAFFRRSALELDAKMMNSLQAAWMNAFLLSDEAHISEAAIEHVSDTSVRPEELFREAQLLIKDRAQRQIATLEPIRDGDKWLYCLPEGSTSRASSSPKTLRRELTRCSNAVKAYGFLHNRSRGLGYVAKMAVGRNLETLRKNGAKTFQLLCDRVGIPPTGRDLLSITELLGHWRRTA
jgi:hypothetical protein